MGRKKSPAALSTELSRQKLFAPSAIPGAIYRARIIEQLEGQAGIPVVILQGPAGHGKTTTLCQIRGQCEQQGMQTVWLTLDDADNDPRRFYAHLQAMLALLLDSQANEEEQRMLGRVTRKSQQPSWVVDQLLIVNRPVALFIDEFQEINNPQILQFFRDLFSRLPPSVCLYVGSRFIPEIGLASLKVKQKVTVVQADELRFSLDEVTDFFGREAQAALNEQEIAAIYQRSEGWPAALQLFSLSLSSQQVRASLVQDSSYRPRELAEYLAESVLDLQSDEIREFLLNTSILNRLSAELCDAVTGGGNSQALLEQLEHSGLFVRSLDADRQWFKYHTLFAECLREQLRERPGAEPEAHRRAAQWYEAHDSYEEAIYHYLALQDYEAAADCLDAWAGPLVARGQLVTVDRWGQRLPSEVVLVRPALTIKLAWVATFLRHVDELQQWLPSLEAWMGKGDVAQTSDPAVVLAMCAIASDDMQRSFEICDQIDINRPDVRGFAAFELGAAANLAAFRWLVQGNLEMAREHLAIAQDFNTRGETGFSYGYTVGLIGVLKMLQGQLGEALNVMQSSMREANMHRDKSVASGALASCQIWALYEAGRWEEAENLFNQHRDVISDGTLMDFLSVSHLCMTRIWTAQGRDAEALSLIDDLDLAARTNRWPRLMRAVGWERVRRALLADELDRANVVAGICKDMGGECEGRPILSYLVCPSLERIRLAIQNHKLDKAAQLLKAEQARSHGKTQQNIRLQIMEARLWLARDDSKAASRHLRSALQLAAPGGFVQCFLDEGPAILQLIQAFQRQHSEDSSGSSEAVIQLAIKVLKAAGYEPVMNQAQSVELPVAELTDREQGLLEFLAAGSSNKDIAKRLFVSENTVKFHLKNIYSKLRVSGRVQALSAARHAGLIED